MANKAFLQSLQATAQSEELSCRYLKKRSAVPIVGSPYRLSAPLLFKVQVQILLVIIYIEFDSPDKSVCKEESLGLAQCAISCSE